MCHSGMASKGLARFPQILTEEDVVLHYYSEEESGEGAADSADTIPPPADAPAPEPEGAPTAEELESGHTKAELVEMAEQVGLDTSGTKADIAARLVAHHSSV